MPVISSGTPTVSVQVPVPTPVQSKPKSPVNFGGDEAPQPQQVPGPTGVPPAPRPKRQLTGVVLPWSPPPKQMKRLPVKRVRYEKVKDVVNPSPILPKKLRRLPVKVVRYSAGTSDVQALLKNLRSHPYDTTQHGVLADALDEAYPGNRVAELIREQYGLGEHGGKGEKETHSAYAPFYNSFDGEFPYHARLGTHGPFNLFLGHEDLGDPGSSEERPRWLLRAVSRFKDSNDSGYTFEIPHEEAHRIPQMFPAAQKHIDPSPPPPAFNPVGVRNYEARKFEDAMDREEDARS